MKAAPQNISNTFDSPFGLHFICLILKTSPNRIFSTLRLSKKGIIFPFHAQYVNQRSQSRRGESKIDNLLPVYRIISYFKCDTKSFALWYSCGLPISIQVPFNGYLMTFFPSAINFSTKSVALKKSS